MVGGHDMTYPGHYYSDGHMFMGSTFNGPVNIAAPPDNFRRAFAVVDPRDERLKLLARKDRLLNNTGAWLRDDLAYRQWKNDPHTRLLWIHGDPGKGKTMMMMAQIAELEQDRLRLTATTAYFFCQNFLISLEEMVFLSKHYSTIDLEEKWMVICLLEGPMRKTGHDSYLEQPLRCSLRTLTIDGAQRRGHEALSYVWSCSNYTEEIRQSNLQAPRPDECRIWCQHEVAEKSGFRYMTKNLIEALSHLRYLSEDRVLWVDAICINQDDESAEKATQVPLMARIYSCASQVIIWLGETLTRPLTDLTLNRRNVTESAFDFAAWVDKLEPDLRDFDYYTSTRPSETFGTVSVMLGNFQELLWRCVWFQRTWTFQEAVMAKQATVMCGSHRASWDALHEACLFISRGMQLPSDIMYGERIVDAIALVLDVQRLRKLRCSPKDTSREHLDNVDPWRFDQLLHAIRSKNAACLHDKVYAILSMASGQNLPCPDYGASFSKVYCDVARCLSRDLERGWLSVLSYAELPKRDIADELKELPSWAPNWSMPTDTAPVSWYADFRAAGSTVDHCSILEDREGNQNHPLLSIRGVRLFTVHAVAKASYEDEDEPINMPWKATESYPLTSEDYLVAYSKVA